MKTVFFIDDSYVMRTALKRWMTKAFKNVNFLVFPNYEQVLEHINEPNLKLIICDEEIHETRLRGSDFINLLNNKKIHIDIIVLSGLQLNLKDFKDEAKLIKHVLQKPVDFESLKDKITALI